MPAREPLARCMREAFRASSRITCGRSEITIVMITRASGSATGRNPPALKTGEPSRQGRPAEGR